MAEPSGVTLVDSNVILDVVTGDPRWSGWSGDALARAADEGALAINPIIYAEVSIGFDRIETLDDVLPSVIFHRFPLPWEAGFLAGKCFARYRRLGGAQALAASRLLYRRACGGERSDASDPRPHVLPHLLPNAEHHRSNTRRLTRRVETLPDVSWRSFGSRAS